MSSTKSYKELVFRCISELSEHETYYSDTKFIEICLIFADLLEISGKRKMFKYMFTNEIGKKSSNVYYIAALVEENEGNLKEALKILENGLKYNIEPKSKLKIAYDNFILRFTKSCFNEGKKILNTEEFEDERQPLEEYFNSKYNQSSNENINYNKNEENKCFEEVIPYFENEDEEESVEYGKNKFEKLFKSDMKSIKERKGIEISKWNKYEEETKELLQHIKQHEDQNEDKREEIEVYNYNTKKDKLKPLDLDLKFNLR